MVEISLATLGRRKIIDFDHTPLPRVLSLFDLTTLGIGTTIGVGFYILAGDVAQSKAGPAVTISFLIAAVTSVFAGLCYAEFGGRVPKAGSAYIYTYVCIGEFIAFIIGWNLILEYVIATASVASGYSHYIDAMAGDSISEALRGSMPMNVSFLGPYPDFLAAGLVVLLSVVLAFGVKESSVFNNIMTVVNMFVVVFVIICTATLAEPSNWTLSTDDLNKTCPVVSGGNDTWETVDYGSGGFAPFGFQGIMAGAAACFYGFVGFDVIASTGEEAIRPERNLPLSICLSLFVIFLSYFGLGTVLTMALPYCQLDNDAPLVKLYEYFDMNTAKIIVSVGALFGFSASLFGAIFPMPRIIYAMASDGLLFRSLSIVNERFRSPIIATFVSGGLAAVMAMLFDLEALINMMSIGTLQAYSIVALCVMLLRYAEDPTDKELELITEKASRKSSLPQHRSSIAPKSSVESFSFKSYVHQAFNPQKLTRPTALSASYVAWATVLFCVLCFILCVLLVVLADELADLDPASMFFCILFFLLSSLVVVTIYLQPQSSAEIQFRAPFVPWLPSLSCFFNLYLMCNLPPNTWVKFVIWLAVGFAIYFFYGICHVDVETTTVGGNTSSGQPNEGFEGDPLEPVIPKILVQPATPMPSGHNTPNATVQGKPPPVVRRSSREAVISPLVTAELAQKKLKKEEEERARREAETSEIKIDVEDGKVIVPTEELIVSSAPPSYSQAVENYQRSIEDPGSDDNKISSGDDSAGAVGVVDAQLARSTEDSDLKNDISDQAVAETEINSPGMKISHSAPVMPLKSASSGPLAKVASEEYIFRDERAPSSVPATPVTKRPVNKDKPLRRMSSFDFIPPSSPTDPLAKTVNGFCVIPVKEPDFEADGNNSGQQIRKASSLDEMVKYGNVSDVDLSSSEESIVGSPREVPHGLGLELGKESIELGVIRERGESKVLANDEAFNALSDIGEEFDKSDKISNSNASDTKEAPEGSSKSSPPNSPLEESTSASTVDDVKVSEGVETSTNAADSLRPYFDLGASSSTESLQASTTKNIREEQPIDNQVTNSAPQMRSPDEPSTDSDPKDAKDSVSSESSTPKGVEMLNNAENSEDKINVNSAAKSESNEPFQNPSNDASNLQATNSVENKFQSFDESNNSPVPSSAPTSTDSWSRPVRSQSSIKNLLQKFSTPGDSSQNVAKEPIKLEKDSNVSELRNKFFK